jgi:DNA-binding LytR/AlgR family response regulator
MKLKCLLVDDEPPALKVLAHHLSNINGTEIIGQCKNALEALDVLNSKPVDLIFLDIKMPKILGTDFLRNLSHPPKVIFVSAYRDYALESYELDAIDYLMKPVSFERFVKAISKAKRLIGQDIAMPRSDAHPQEENFIYLRVDKKMQKVLVNQIVYIESWKDYIKVFLDNGKNLLVKQSISATENMLSERKFLRVHRSYMVSIQKITGYSYLSVLVDKMEIPIGRLYKQSVLDALKNT